MQTLKFIIYFVGMAQTLNVGALTLDQVKEMLSSPITVGKASINFFGASQLANNDQIGTRFDYEWIGQDVRIKQTLFPNQKDTTNSVTYEAGDYQGQAWEHSKQRLILFDKGAQKIDNSIGGRGIFQCLVHLGVQYLLPDSIVWNETSFTGDVLIDNHRFPIVGQVIVGTNWHRVEGLNYQIKNSDLAYKIKYIYDNPDENQFPSKIIIYGFGAVGNNPLMVFDINEFINNPQITEADLNPTNLYPQDEKVQITKSGLRASSIPTGPTGVSHNMRYVVLSLFALPTAICFWLIIKLSTSKNRN